MQYKGDDLDLRVPQGRGPREGYSDYESTLVNGRWPQQAAYPSAGRDPLWVDETVLACCNYAYDIAQANGAGEVGLEHLVNALTRVEGAARVLETRGVREAQLRRDSATLIASEIPLTASHERTAPRRSPDFEDLLRRAVENASRRGTAAGIDDLLWVLLHSSRDLPAVQLLRRLTPDWQRLEWSWSRPRERDYAAPPRDYVPPQADYVRAPAAAVYTAPLDTMTSRMSLIEDSLRSLHAELAGERKALSDLIRDTQRDVVAQRGDAASLRSDISQRLEMLERGLQARPDGSRLTVQLSDRIQTLEKAVHGGMNEGARNWAALGQRLQAIETAMTSPENELPVSKALLERLDGLETYLVSAGAESSGNQAVIDRITSIEQTIEGRLSQSQRVWSGVTDRLQSIERVIEAGAGEGGRNWTQIAERFGTLEAMIRARPASTAGPEFSDLTERVAGLERAVRSGFGDAVRMSTAVSERLDLIDKRTTTLPPDSETVLVLDDRMQSIERMLQDQLASPAAAMAVAPEWGQRLGAIVELQQQASARNDQLANLVREMTARLGPIEQQVASAVMRTSEAAQGRDREVAEMHEAIVRLSENQHTLASAIADWRHESQSDFGSISSQLERFSEPSRNSAPEAAVMPNAVREATLRQTSISQTTDLDVGRGSDQLRDLSMRQSVGIGGDSEPSIEMIRPRGHGFWWWLFGTDDITRSNREAEIRWQRMHARIKEARDRRRERA